MSTVKVLTSGRYTGLVMSEEARPQPAANPVDDSRFRTSLSLEWSNLALKNHTS